VPAVRDWVFGAKHLPADRLQLRGRHPGQIADLRKPAIFAHDLRDSFLRRVNVSSRGLNSPALSRASVDGIGPASRIPARRRYAATNSAAISLMAPPTLRMDHYNNLRLNSATGYITPKDMLAGRQQEVHPERDRKLEAARRQRRIRRRQAA
jgi:hypothetical protein